MNSDISNISNFIMFECDAISDCFCTGCSMDYICCRWNCNKLP